jgi:hypothetical protein
VIKSILKFFRIIEHDIEDIIGDFVKTAERLAKKADSLYLEGVEKAEEAEHLVAQSKAAHLASEKAGQIASNIRNLINA